MRSPRSRLRVIASVACGLVALVVLALAVGVAVRPHSTSGDLGYYRGIEQCRLQLASTPGGPPTVSVTPRRGLKSAGRQCRERVDDAKIYYDPITRTETSGPSNSVWGAVVLAVVALGLGLLSFRLLRPSKGPRTVAGFTRVSASEARHASGAVVRLADDGRHVEYAKGGRVAQVEADLTARPIVLTRASTRWISPVAETPSDQETDTVIATVQQGLDALDRLPPAP